MTRFATVLTAALLLGACSSEGTSPVFTAIKEVVFPSQEEDTATPPAPADNGITRERITANGLAMVYANIEGEDIRNVLTATSLNGDYVTYVSSFRQSITMLGALITATRGLGGDLLAVASRDTDPVARLTPIDAWPDRLTRDYRFPGFGPAGTVVSVTCTLSKGTPTQITIFEITYDVTPVTENCTSADGKVAFTNTYLADKDGQVWRSRQWVGDKVGYMLFDVLEPFTSE